MPLDGAFELTGVGIRLAQITDGLSSTIMVGEKHVPRNQMGRGGWDCSTYNGDYPQCSTRTGGPDTPLAISQMDQRWAFGSYHIGVCQFAFADGSVRPVANTIDPNTLGLLARRDDGQVIPDF
jgi:prepilin-type processing-associated H-X9-DG protein